MPSYVLTKAADDDVEQIVRYTINQWGEAQAQKYVERLQECFEKIAEESVISRTISKRYPQVRVTRCEHHYIFFLPPPPPPHENQPFSILAVLHERMDMLVSLKGRLAED